MQNSRVFVFLLCISCVLTPMQIMAADAAKVVSQTKKIDLNAVSAETLAHSFKGIGLKRAEAIISYREAHGRFQAVSDLEAVKGLGKSFVQRNIIELEKVFSVD